MKSFQTETPAINGDKWKLECHETAPGQTKLVVRSPRVQPRAPDGKPETHTDPSVAPHQGQGLQPEPDLDAVKLTAQGASHTAAVAEDVLTLNAGGLAAGAAGDTAGSSHGEAISVAESSMKALNLYEFGLNRALCQDPVNDQAPRQTESHLQLLMSRRTPHVIPRVGRRWLAYASPAGMQVHGRVF